MNAENSVRGLLNEATRALAGNEARREAELLLQYVLGCERAWLYAHDDDIAEPALAQRFRNLLARRAAGEPIAYLIGRREFWSLDLAITSDVLIPRPETELLVELALRHIPQEEKVEIADLGTGSGAIALALAQARPLATVFATDNSAAVLAVAAANAQRLGMENIRFHQGDWYAALDNCRFDLIVSNPPYIADTDIHLANGDLRFEPRIALASGADGLNAIRAIVGQASAYLKTGAWLLIEHGYDQGRTVRSLLEASGFVEVFTARDLEDRERVSGAHKSL